MESIMDKTVLNILTDQLICLKRAVSKESRIKNTAVVLKKHRYLVMSYKSNRILIYLDNLLYDLVRMNRNDKYFL